MQARLAPSGIDPVGAVLPLQLIAGKAHAVDDRQARPALQLDKAGKALPVKRNDVLALWNGLKNLRVFPLRKGVNLVILIPDLDRGHLCGGVVGDHAGIVAVPEKSPDPGLFIAQRPHAGVVPGPLRAPRREVSELQVPYEKQVIAVTELLQPGKRQPVFAKGILSRLAT